METVTSHDGFTVTSSTETADEMRDVLAQPEPIGDPDPAPEPEPKPPADAKPSVDRRSREGKKASIQQEIDALVGTKHHTEREVEAARNELARLRAEYTEVSRQRPTAEPQKPASPQTFPSYAEMQTKEPELTPEQWLDQRDEWRDARKAEVESRRQSEAQHAGRVKTFDERVRKAESTEPGFWASVKPIADMLVPVKELRPGQQPTGANAIADVILDSDISDQLLRHFRDNPSDFQRISTLHPIQVFREMGKIESRLEAASATGPAPKATVISQASAPLKPVVASPVMSGDETPEEDLDFDEFARRRNAQERKRHYYSCLIAGEVRQHCESIRATATNTR